MFEDGEIDGVIIRKVSPFADDRGWLMEIFRSDELDGEYSPAMAYISLTRPGVARGPHEHVEQADLFCFAGPSDFRVYLWDNRQGSSTFRKRMVLTAGASDPAVVIIPRKVVHAYRNIGKTDGFVINCPNRLYRGEGRGEEVDEVRYEDDPSSPFRLD